MQINIDHNSYSAPRPNLKALWILMIIFIFAFSPEAYSDSLNVDLGDIGHSSMTSRILQITALITILSIAPAILMMVTSFTRIVVVLSFARTAIGLQQTPPNIVLSSLALFLTFFIMTPTLKTAYDNGIVPLIQEEIDEQQAWQRISAPFQQFMLANTRQKDLQLFVSMAELELNDPKDTPMQVLIPSFMLSELKRAFEIGFLLFLPFLIIDMLVASTLMAMGMMMLPPVMLSLPFKLIFFVLVDGWHVLCESLVKSYSG